MTLLDREKHVKYWRRCYTTYLPSQYTTADSTRMLFAAFIISALDLLAAPLAAEDRVAIRAWVFSLQHPDGGFCGSSTHALQGRQAKNGTANLAATFFALILLGLAADGEDEAPQAFLGVKRTKLLRWLRRLQREDGSFGQVLWEGKPVGGSDTRHSYMASCIRWMLRTPQNENKKDDLLEDINVDKMITHIRSGMSYDGGLSEGPSNEAHAGYVYCSVAALSFVDQPPNVSAAASNAFRKGVSDLGALLRFLAYRQFAFLEEEEDRESKSEEEDDNYILESKLGELSVSDDGRCEYVGFNGRVNKKADTCYSWWVSGALSILGRPDLVDVAPSKRYLLDLAQHPIGGFPKVVGAPPDVFHSYVSLAALATMGATDLKEFDPGLCCSRDTTRKIERARQGLQEAEGKLRRASSWDRDGFWESARGEPATA